MRATVYSGPSFRSLLPACLARRRACLKMRRTDGCLPAMLPRTTNPVQAMSVLQERYDPNREPAGDQPSGRP